jgi:hypothetical protein
VFRNVPPTNAEYPRNGGYPRDMSNALVVRVVVMAVVVAVVAVWLHLWWLALLYVAFWGFMLLRGRRRATRR